MKHFTRSDRLGGQMLRDVSELLDMELKQVAGGLTTFTRVQLTKDLRYAKIYYSFLGEDEDRKIIEGFLERERRRVRHQLGKNLRIRHIPEITFVFDPSIEHGIRIEQLLNDIKREQSEDE
jgi:ribosome-binding factor A